MSATKQQAAVQPTQQVVAPEPSFFGAITNLGKVAANTATNGLKMIDNAFVAGERITYIAASKASNLADISDTADTMKLLLAKKQLQDQIKANGITVHEDGSMTF